MPQLVNRPRAVLAAVLVAREEEGVGYLTTEPAGDVDKPDEADDGWSREDQPLTSDRFIALRFYDLRLPFDHQTKGAANRNHGQGFKRRVQGETAHRILSGEQTFLAS